MDDLWIRDVLVLYVDSVGETLASSTLDMAIMRAIVVLGRENVPAVNGMIIPHASLVGLFVNLRRAPHRCELHLAIPCH